MNRVKNDLSRMALVMAVAAIDSYMHALVHRRIATVRRSADLPSALARLEMPFSDLARLADASIKAQRQQHASRPWVQVKTALQKRLLKETFQSYDQVATALAIAGVEKGWSKVAGELGESAGQSKRRLNSLIHRRNQIVHEGDIKRRSRPQKLSFNNIAQARASHEIDWMDSLIKAIHIVVEKNP